MARKSNPSLGAHADALESMARDVAREHSISLSEARSRVRAELQRARDKALSTTAVEGHRRPNPIPLEPPPHVAHGLAELSDESLRANHDRALKQINVGAPAKRDASNRLVCWSLWEAHRRGLEFDRSHGAVAQPRASNPVERPCCSGPVAENYGFVADDGKVAPMHPRSQNPHGHYLDVVLGEQDTVFVDDVPVATIGDGSAYVTEPTDAGYVLHLNHHGHLYSGMVLYGLRPMQVRLVTQPHPSRRLLGMPHPGHRHGNPTAPPLGNQVAHTKYGVSKDELIRQTKALYEEAYRADPVYIAEATEKILGRDAFVWDSLTLEQISALRQVLFVVRLDNPVGTRNSAMGTRVTRTRHPNESGEYEVRHWVRGEMVGEYGTTSEQDAIDVQRYLTGEHHGHPRPDIQKFLGERHGPTPCRDDGRFCGGEGPSSGRMSNPTSAKSAKPKTDWNKKTLQDGDKSFVRMVMSNVHVGTTEAEVVQMWAQRKHIRDHLDTPLAHALINQALDAHWENILVYESVTSMRKLPRTRPSKGQPIPGLPPIRTQAKDAPKRKPKALPAAKTPPMLPPAPHDRTDNPIGHWKY